MATPKDDKALTGDFNKATDKPPEKAVLEAVTQARRSLALTQALKDKDWQEAAKLLDAGADPLKRGAAALKEVFEAKTPEAIALAEKMDIAPRTGLTGLPYLLAAQLGDLAKLEEGLQKDLDRETKSSMLFMALRNGQETAADRVLQDLAVEDMRENALFALLVHRPEIYETATAAQKHAPDYLGHFYNACMVDEEAAMEKALQKMVDNKKRLPLYIFFDDDFDGMAYNRMLEYTEAVMKTGNLPVIKKFLENFLDEMTPGKQPVISAACGLEKDQPGILKAVLETVKPNEYEVKFAVTSTVDNAATAKILMELYPEEVKKSPQGTLLALAQDGDAAQQAVATGGVSFPEDDKARAAIVAAAIFAGNDKGEKWLLQQCDMTPGFLEALRDNHNYKVVKRGWELGGDIRAKDDALFWKAVANGDQTVIDAYPRKPLLSTETSWLALEAVRKTAEKGDMALLADILENADWSDAKLQERLFRDLLGNAPAMQAALEAGIPPIEELQVRDSLAIAKGDGGISLDWLDKNTDIDIEGETAEAALRSAVQKNAPGMIEYLLARGTSLGKDASFLSYAISENAEDEALTALEKWITRGETRAAPGLAKDIESGKPLFGGADSLAVQAAYADKFTDIIVKTAQEKSFDPALLVSTTDEYGNTLLDILGAHGRLNDVFAVPMLWKDSEAASFIHDNSSKLYHYQCDFAGLKAAIDLLRLHHKGRQDRFKLK